MLSSNWITEGINDFEYKKYILLAYLKNVRDSFTENKLYPHLSELITHYTNLKRLKENQEILIEDMPKEISAIDLEKLRIIYKKIALDDLLMEEIFEVINYAIPKMKNLLDDGKEKYEFVEKNISFEPVGVLPLYKKEGYFILDTVHKNTHIYRYTISGIKTLNENLVAIRTELVGKERRTLTNHYPQIKLNLIRNFKELPNPATYSIYSALPFPIQDTLLPIAERLLLRQTAA